jgi:hypothetical protein
MAYSSDEFIADPTNHILAIIEDYARAEDAERALKGAGFEEVRVYRGFKGADAIDSRGTEHGMVGQAVRAVEEALSNKDNLAEYEDAVKDGSSVVALRIGDDEQRDWAVVILEGQGAHTINHFGAALVTTIKP